MRWALVYAPARDAQTGGSVFGPGFMAGVNALLLGPLLDPGWGPAAGDYFVGGPDRGSLCCSPPIRGSCSGLWL